MTERAGTVVLGVGNPLMADDGLGLAALEELRRWWSFTPSVELIDGGTWGMNLLHVIEGAERLLILDAIDAGAPAGRLVELRGEQLPRYFSHKLSPHQIDLREVLALAELRGRLPIAIAAVGLQPLRIDMQTELSPLLYARLPLVVARARRILAGWGHRSEPRRRLAYA